MTKQFPQIYDASFEAMTFRHLHGKIGIDAPLHSNIVHLEINFWTFGHASQQSDNTFHHPVPPFNRLFFFREKGGKLKHANGTTEMSPGIFYLLPENYPFTSTYYFEGEMFFIHFTINDRSLHHIFSKVSHIIKLDSPPFAELFSKQAGPSKWNTELQTLVSAIILKMIPEEVQYEIEERDGLAKEFNEIYNLLNTTPPAAVRISDLAEATGLTPGSLARRFNRKFGISLKEFIHRQTLKEANRLLISCSYTIAEIADKLGFIDRHYFYNYFKKHTGCSPGEFRKNHTTP